MRNKLKRIWMSVCVAVVAMVVVVAAPLSVWATNVSVSAGRDDVYNQLMEAAKINVITNTLKKCLGSVETNISPADAQAGKIFSGGWTGLSNTDISTALWVEDILQGNGGDDGAIWCKQDGGGQNILQLFASLTGMSLQNEILCQQGMPGLLVRWEYTVDGWTKVDRNCSSFNSSTSAVFYNPRGMDANGNYSADDERSYFLEYIYRPWYNSHKASNPYLPAPNEIGSFNNVDGYFNYLLDFNLKCASNTTRVTAANKQGATDYYKITQFDKSGNKVTATNYYYQLSSNNYWTYGLSSENSVTSCSGLLDRISALQSTANRVTLDAGRSDGYGGIILSELNNACKNAKTSDGNNGWSELKRQLEQIANDPEASEETVAEANSNLGKVNGIISSGNYTESSGLEDDEGGKVYQCVDIDGLTINIDDYDTPITDIAPGSMPDTTTENEDPCYNQQVEGMSWLLCPAINNMTYTIDGIDATLANMMSVDRSYYDSGTATEDAWGKFRDIANVILIIIFTVIVFSQLTGYGIDNYGIKKMLPRLLLMAVVINLSFVICQLAIDISNIAGVGLSNLFKAIGEPLYGGYTPGEFFATLVDALFAVGAGAAAGAMVIISAASIVTGGAGVMIVISLVLSLLVALVAILFFFLMLGARMIIIIIFTAIAPVALACYIMPNTQAIFRKWWTVFKAALLVYPICGAMYGLSFIIRGIVFGGGPVSFWMAMIAVFVQFLPFFLLPSLLRGAIAAMGQVGGFIAGASAGIRRGIGSANNTLRMTEAYKSEAELQRRRSTAQRAWTNPDGTFRSTKDMNRWQRMWRGGERGVARARSQYIADVRTTGLEQNMMGVGAEARLDSAKEDILNDTYKSYQTRYGGYSKAQLTSEAKDAVKAGGTSWYTGDDESTQKMRALIGAMESSGMQRDIYQMLSQLDGTGGKQNIGDNTRVMQDLAKSSDKVMKAYGKKGAGMSYDDFMDKQVYRDSTGALTTDATKAVGGPVASSMMQQYVTEKGTDFLEGLDDKALSEIGRHSTATNKIMSTGLLTSAAAKINSQDAVSEIDKMLMVRSGSEIKSALTGAQLSSFNDSTVNALYTRAYAPGSAPGAGTILDADLAGAINDASDDIAKDPRLISKLSATPRAQINDIRIKNGQTAL